MSGYDTEKNPTGKKPYWKKALSCTLTSAVPL